MKGVRIAYFQVVVDFNSSFLDFDVEFYVPFDGVEGPSYLVSQIVHSFVEVTCGADVYAEVDIVYVLQGNDVQIEFVVLASGPFWNTIIFVLLRFTVRAQV